MEYIYKTKPSTKHAPGNQNCLLTFVLYSYNLFNNKNIYLQIKYTKQKTRFDIK